MRTVFVAAIAALAASAPAHARSAQHDLDRAGDMLSSPIAQELAAAQMSRMLAALMDIRIDGIAKAMEPLDRGRMSDDLEGGRTLGDLAERDDPYFEDRMRDKTRAAVGTMGALAKAMAVALPELERAARRMEDALPRR